MIKFALRCGDGHHFDSWFQSDEAFASLAAAGRLACPECGDARIAKALMAPKVRDSRKAAQPPQDEVAPTGEDRERALAELRAHVEQNSEYVGLNFAAEARAIHDGSSPERAIYGEAKIAEARALIEDGVPVAPLPFAPRRKMN